MFSNRGSRESTAGVSNFFCQRDSPVSRIVSVERRWPGQFFKTTASRVFESGHDLLPGRHIELDGNVCGT
jgi:hypothetical protein